MTRDAQKLRAQAERGRQADELMNHPLMLEAFDNLEKEIETGWKNSSGGDREAREEAYRLHRAVLRLRGILKQFVVSGGNAKLLLQTEESKADADSEPVAQNQGDDAAPEQAAPRSLSLLAQEEFGDDFHGDVAAPPKTPPATPEDEQPATPEIPDIPDEDLDEGGENTQVEGDDKSEAAKPAAEEEAEPIATVRELVEHLEADPVWFSGLRVDVVVDGNTSQVPLKELIDNYQIREAADERLGQAKTRFAQAQQEIAERNTAIDLQYEQAAKLVLMQEQQLTADIAAINWDELKRDDPAMWAAQRQGLRERQEQIQQAKQQTLAGYQQVRTQREQEQKDWRAATQTEQSQLLMEAMPKISPDWGDPQKTPEAKYRLSTYLLGQGFAPKEIEDTLDYRSFVVAEKARLWDESQSKLQVAKKRIQTVPKVMKPGAGKEPTTVNLEKVREAQKRLRQSGRMEDALAVRKLLRTQ